MENIFTQEMLFLRGILNDINDQDTSFLDCKHKHMIKSGAPPDKIGVLYCLLPIEFHGFTKLISKGYHYLVTGLISIFLEAVWAPLANLNNLISPDMKFTLRSVFSFKFVKE